MVGWTIIKIPLFFQPTALINYLQHGDRLSATTGLGGGDVLHLTMSNKWEFPRDRLVLQNVLGSGAFGIVMKADAEGISGYNSGTTPVAVKFVKGMNAE